MRRSGPNSSVPGKAASEISSVLREEAGASTALAGREQLVKQLGSEEKALAKLLLRLQIEPKHGKDLGRGGEHLVQDSDDPSKVQKFTLDGYGHTIQATSAPLGKFAQLRKALPSEYIDRLDLHNEAFATDYRVEGLSKKMGSGNAPSIVTSQSFIEGEKPSQEEADSTMGKLGFTKVHDDQVMGDQMTGRTWYRTRDKVIATDVKPENFVKGEDGQIFPIDLICRKADSSDLETAMQEGTRKR